ncbi:xanthine dehydrogenase family protein molybdopterin-binding subunit [Nitrogeniibacter mangrovi]|uniref:Xanthine dehydrogenase family protein molybdopterin-binding subunit n=1 Tax=Nitrogeniibacter mangrovi TaxID=2016596 RepID=A0A6C1B2N5_9RHOO|nr:xanthine dehydrogenase family protein molybdopterin-binding subunit [Nitrogeniibacter mangrovi]QID17902.1 xanthine dehydrogenase family protein molybdopterin-binding subunit [Nitrogeniibacter mangrovi]
MNKHNTTIANVSRRGFLKQGTGLTLGLMLPAATHKVFAAAGVAGPGKAGDAAVVDGRFTPNAFVRIGADDTVTVVAKHLEMGQGSHTGLATLVAEELDADWDRVVVEGAPADASHYNNLFWGPNQGTGGSTAIANSFMQMRQAGAAARAMLVAAAAAEWGVKPEEISVRRGVLSHAASKRELRFGALADAAARQAVPENPTLKDPKDFVLIGKRAPRKDSAAKCTGKAHFTQDMQLPGMLVAVVAHPPRFGATVKTVDDAAARKLKGVVDVVRIPTGVAVLAHDTWTAKKGRDALKITWDESKAWRGSSAGLIESYRKLASEPGLPARKDGDAPAALAAAKAPVEAEFVFPYLAHAAMEPLNCVVHLHDGMCEVWNGEQFQTSDQKVLAELFGLDVSKVKLNMLFAGGSFGRRASPTSDYVLEAAHIAKAIDGRAPVKMVWMREDDMRAGYYRPLYVHRITAALGADGKPAAWSHRIVGQSIIKGSPFEGMLIKDGVDVTSVEGAATLPYAIPNLQVDLHTTNDQVAVPVQWWRSVGSTHTGFSTEVFIDMLARAAKADPVDYRLALLDKHPRHAAVLKLAAEQAGWSRPLAKGNGGRRGRGVAVHESFNTIVGQVVEVTVSDGGELSVDRVVCAVDCGVAVNPDVIRAQMEGSIGFALAAALSGEITIEDGQVVQSNFHDYTVLRINQMPKVEVHIVPSAEKPTGVGEPGVPPLAPALANAIHAAVGKQITRLPIGDQLSA